MRVHFIAIGGAIMHNLAIALKDKGYEVSGSDDVIFDPSKSLLERKGLLPSEFGFFPEKITKDLDAIILGMHAKMDNPELTRAMELGIKVYSFPEYIYEQSKDKKRVVIAGSHGKTTITSMIMHVLKDAQIDFDYMVGSSVAGFENNVKLSESAPIIILEGDEYLTSALQKEPKFKYYKGNIALLSGIAWDHINVFPTFEIYLNQFEKLLESLEADAHLVYFNEDENITHILQNTLRKIDAIPYGTPEYHIENEQSIITSENINYPLNVFGKHNLQNIEGARKVCNLLGVENTAFYKSIQSFSGAGRRLELIRKDSKTLFYKDFAHSPSKLQATVKSVKETYPNKQLIACMELHTFSSLKKDFLPQFKDSMNMADTAIVFVNEETVKQKGSELFTEQEIKSQFNNYSIRYFTQKEQLENFLLNQDRNDKVFLMMSSGNFGGIDLKELSFKIFDEEKKNISNEIPRVEPIIEIIQPYSASEEEKKTLYLLHIGGFLTTFIIPLIFHATTTSPLIKKEAAKAFNFQMSLLLLALISSIFICCFGFAIWGVLILISAIYTLINCINVSNNKAGEYFENIRDNEIKINRKIIELAAHPLIPRNS